MKILGFLTDVYTKPETVAILCTIILVLAYPGYRLAEWAYTSVKFEILEDELRGTPPYRTEREVKFGDNMDIVVKCSLIAYPDPRSCIEDGVETLTLEALRRMDWGKMEQTAHVNVCAFRLLASSGDISHATEWFEFNGFRVPDGFSSASPQTDLDGSLRVYGVWSIRENDPRFSARGLAGFLIPALAHEMLINASWSADGRQLLYVSVGYNTK